MQDAGAIKGRRVDGGHPLPYRKVMGAAYDRLADPLRQVHSFDKPSLHAGAADVTGPENVVGGLVSRVMGLPKAGKDVPVMVGMRRVGDIETWTRTYAGKPFHSELAPGRDGSRMEGMLTERMGPLLFGMDVVEDRGGLSLVMRTWSAFGIPMPNFVLPRVRAVEHGRDGRFNFSVEIGLPMIGRLVKYEGWISPESETRGVEAHERAR